MNFKEPKVEFVSIEANDIVTNTSCNLTTSSQQGSGETCRGCDAEMNNCTDFMNNNPVKK